MSYECVCVSEIGVNLRPNSMVKYDFLGSWRSTINEKIRVGFTTTNPKGFLLGFYSNISGEYLTLMVSNSGPSQSLTSISMCACVYKLRLK